MRLGVNVRHADEQLRGTLALPNGLGKDVTIAVFAEGDAARAAEEAGADHVGAADLAAKVEEGWTDFDVAIATPALMGPVVSKLGRVLGPQGKMPNPKVGTVTDDVAKAVGEAKTGKVEYRTDRQAVIHMAIGKASFTRARAARELRRGDRRDRPRQAGRRQGPLPALDHAHDDDGPRHQGRHRGHPRGRDPRASRSTSRAATAPPRPGAEESRRGRARAEEALPTERGGADGRHCRVRTAYSGCKPQSIADRVIYGSPHASTASLRERQLIAAGRDAASDRTSSARAAILVKVHRACTVVGSRFRRRTRARDGGACCACRAEVDPEPSQRGGTLDISPTPPPRKSHHSRAGRCPAIPKITVHRSDSIASGRPPAPRRHASLKPAAQRSWSIAAVS